MHINQTIVVAICENKPQQNVYICIVSKNKLKEEQVFDTTRRQYLYQAFFLVDVTQFQNKLLYILLNSIFFIFTYLYHGVTWKVMRIQAQKTIIHFYDRLMTLFRVQTIR